MEKSELAQLETLLQRRLDIIADHDWRDRDSDEHLEALKSVSEELEAEADGLGPVPGQLSHFLKQRSYLKALNFIRAL